ncbi:hypothetical protein L1987_43796 [Smallanthus sonchifolius]|uniref:Uncharacterized protein n=1 Tax=Smallanthus sonchifolius TaxID=185202 RepID=A0ACB9GND3_9ASTR|nr:hypothetical protein L1987_43796 [Smallanthus sonchifolius]
MATEINIQESVYLKNGESEENRLTSESFEEKVTELLVNKVKQLETSSQVAETVNTPLETSKPTAESGIFFQALSVPMVIADEKSNTPESCKPAKQTEPKEETIKFEEEAIENEVREEDAPEKVESEVGSKLFDSMAPIMKETLEKNQGDSDGVTSSQDAACEDIKETTEHDVTTVADLIKEQDRDFVKEEPEDKSVDAQEASEQCEIGSKDIEEQKSEENIDKIEQDEEIRPVKVENGNSSVELNEAIPTLNKDEDEEKEQEVNVLEKDQDKDDITSAEEVTFEGGLQEKNDHNEDNEHEVVKAKASIEDDTDVYVSKQTTPVKESIKNEEPDDEKAIEKEVCEEKAELEGGIEISDSVMPSQKEPVNVIEKDQGDSDGVTSSQEAPCVDLDETTTVIDFKEQDLNEKPREFIEEETEDKSLDAQEANEECEKGAKEDIEQNPEGSVKKTEKEEETEEIKPGVEIEKKEQNELLPAITTDVCIPIQTKSQVEETEQEEEDTQNDDGLKEKSDSPSIKEVCEETGSEKAEYEEIATVNKGENGDEEKEQEVNVLEKDESKDDVTSAQDVAFEKDLPEKNHHNEDNESDVVTAEESIEKDTEVIGSSKKTEPSDVCISTLTEQEEETTEKNDEEAVESDGGQTNNSGTPMVKEIHEENVSEKNEAEQGLKLSDSSSTALNENETVRENEDQEKEQEIYVLEESQGGRDDVTSSENASNKDIKEATIGQHDTTVAYSETGQGLSATSREILIEAEDKSVDAREETKQYDDGANDEREQKLEESVDETANSCSKNEQEEYTEEIKPSVETIEEKDVCISTQIESQEEAAKNEENAIESDGDKVKPTEYEVKATESEENNDEETIKNDGGQTEKPESPLTEVVCEATSTEMAESEEGVKHFDSFSMALNENETLSKEEKLEKEDEIKSSEEVQGGDDVTISQNASSEDKKETTIGQHDTTEAYVEEGQGVNAMPKKILIEAEDKSIDAEEISLELGQPNEQNVEETHPCQAINENPEDEIKKEDKDLSHEIVEDTNENNTKEEKCTIEQETVEKHSGQDEVSKEKVNDLNETTEVDPREDITPPASLEDTSNSEKEKTESEILPIEDHETVSKVQIPELEPKSEESVLKEECFISETETHLDEEKEIVTKEISSDEKIEVEGGGDDVTSSQNASSEDAQEITTGQHVTTVAYVEEGQGVSSTPKEILIEEAEDKYIDAEEISRKPNEQDVDETRPYVSEIISENPEDEIKKEDKDLSHESVEDTNDDTIKEEKCTLEQEPVEEHSGRDDVSKEKVTDLSAITEVEPQEGIIPSTSLETSTEDTSNSEKEKAESENLPIEDLETVSEIQIPELVPKSEESVQKEECFTSETEKHLDEEKEIVSKEISSDEKTEVQGGGDDVTSSQNASSEDIQETTIDQHVTTVAYVEDGQGVSTTPKEIVIEEAEGKSIDAKEISLELGEPNEQNIEETHPYLSEIISENAEDEIKKEEKDLSHESVEDTNDDAIKEEKCTLEQEPVEEHSGRDKVSKEKVTDLNETTEVEPQEDIIPFTSLETSTEDTSNSEKEKAESANLPIQDLETVSEVQIPELVPKSEESVLKEEYFISETETHLDEKQETITKEISSDEMQKTEQATEIKQDTVKEICEETSSEKTELEEGLKLSDSSDIKINEKDRTNLKDDEEEKDHEVDMSAESQGEDNITSSQNEVSEEKEDLKEKNYYNEGSEGDFIKSGEGVDEDTEEIKSSVETKETATNVCSSTQIKTDEETIVNEEKNGEKAIEYDENEAVSGEENLEKKQDVEETKMGEHATTVTYTEEGQSLATVTKDVYDKEEGDKSFVVQEETEQYDDGENDREQKPEEHTDVTSSQNASNEDIKETTIDQHDTTMAYVEEGQGVIAMPKDILIEAEDKSIDAEEISLELREPNEQNVDETRPCPSEIISENPEDENNKVDKDLSHESVEDTSDNNTEVEKPTLEQVSVEEHNDQDEVSKEKVTDLNETTEVEPQEDITPSTSLETSTEDTSNSKKEKAKSETLPTEDLETVSEVQIPELVPKSEDSVLKEECFISETETHLNEEKGTITEEISSDEKTEQTTEIKQEIVKEECEETRSEKAEIEEGLELSNEKGITGFEDENQEKDQENSVSAESQCEDNITSSRKEASEEKEGLQESNESDFIRSREGVDEDTEEVKSSVETKENTEHVITTNVCSSTQIEPVEETTENEEKNGEKAIENDENEIVSREEKIENKQEDVCSSAQTEPKEETIYNEETNEEAIENDDGQMNLEILENQEKKQELEISELQSGGDDVISSQNVSNEDIKETAIGQHATTTAHFEEGLSVNAITKEIIKEEVEDKSVHAQETSEQSENGAKDNIEQQPEESVDKHVNSCSKTIEGSTKEEADAENKEIESELEAEKQADRTEDRSEMKDEPVLTEKVTKELGQPNEQNVEEIHACLTETTSETTEDKITKKDEDISHDSTEHINENITKEEKCFPDGITKEIEISTLEHEPVGEQNDSQDEVSKERFTDLNETTAVEPQEDVTPSSSLGTSTEDTSSSDKAKAESENLPIEDLESVSEVHIPEVIPISEDSKMKEECLISATATHVDEENGTVTRESPSDENLESTHQPENSYSTIEESVSQLEQTGEINSLYENRDMKEDVTQETQLNSTEDSGEMVKDAILTKEIEQVPLEIEKEKGLNDFKEQIVEEDSYSPELEEKSAQNQKEIVHEISKLDSIPVENPEVTETNIHGQIGQEDNSCESKVTNDRVDQEAKEETIPSLEDASTVESQVNLSNIESTTYPSETEKLVTRALESDCDVQIPEVVADSEESKVKEECTVLETAEYTDENKVEEQDTKTNEISSAPDKEQEIFTEAPTKGDEAKSSDLIIEEKALTKENLEVHGELELTSEPVIEKDHVTIETKPQPKSDITCENITDDQTLESKLEHTTGKDLEDAKGDKEEDATLAPENQIKSTESQNETTKNIVLTDEVAVETEKEMERSEIEGQVSEEDNCPTELDNITSTPNQKELANEIEYSKPIPVGDTEVTEVKAESQIVETIQAAEDLSCSSKASPIIETSKVEMHEDTEQTTTIVEEVKDDSIDEASKDKIIPVLEDSKASELQVDLPELESTDTPLNGQDSMELNEDVSCRTQETNEEQGVRISQLAEREILEEKDVELISGVQTFSEDQRSIKEKAQGSFGVEIKGAKSENEAVEDVIINEVLLEDEKAKESKGIKDIINEEAKLNQSTSDTDEVCQIERSSSRPDELFEAKDSVEDTEDPKFLADNLNVKDETFTVVKGPIEDSEVIASEIERLEKTVTEENIIKADADKEKVTLGEPQADDSAKATYDSTMSSTEQDVIARSEESRDDNMLKLEEKPTEVPENTTEVAKIVPECREASATDVKIREQGELVHHGSQEPSEENTLLSQNGKNTENLEVLPSVEKDGIEGVDKRFEEALVIDVQKHEKDLDHETKDKIEDVESNVECSEIEPLHLEIKEATSEFINQENQREQKKEADESIEAVIPVEDVKTSTREIEVGSVDVEVPSVTDATANKSNSKTVEVHEAGKEEGSAMKQEPLELDAPETFGTATTQDLKISQKSVTDDLINISQTHPEVQKYEVPAYTVDKQSPNEPHQKESTESKTLTEKIDSSHEQGEPIAKSLIPEPANLKANEASGTEPQTSKTAFIDQKEKSESVEPAKFKMADVLQEPAKGNSEVAETLIGERDSALTKDQQVEKEEIGESGVKTDEEGEEEEEDNEDDEKIGSCSDAPVMVEASKDMEVKAPKKSHNILSGVGSKVKHSIAKVKKAITGKSSPKPPSPKAKNQVVG